MRRQMKRNKDQREDKEWYTEYLNTNSLVHEFINFFLKCFNNCKWLMILQSRQIQESGWRPRWFEPQGESESYKYTGGYWEARDVKSWDDCPNIFGEFTEEVADCA